MRAVIVCLCVISCLNEGQVNEINFSCPYMGIALTDSRIVTLCLSVCVCHVAPRLPAHVHPQACTACEAVAPPLSCVATFASAQLQKHFKSFIHLLKQLLKKKRVIRKHLVFEKQSHKHSTTCWSVANRPSTSLYVCPSAGLHHLRKVNEGYHFF